MHILEAGHESPGRPAVLLLHGFPELAYSWRKVVPALAAAGFHVIAPDQRGYGRTTGWDGRYDGDVASFRFLNLVRDLVALLSALGVKSTAVAGHDFGSPVAAWCSLIRPDLFRPAVLMSAPFAGPPSPAAPAAFTGPSIHDQLAALIRPRKHYQWYYSTREANDNMMRCPQGIHAFLRAYYHMKSADWKRNQPHTLRSWTASELAQLPSYYVMDRAKGMAETVAAEMPTAAQIAACAWLTDEELRVYSSEFQRTGFQGGLQWYRCGTANHNADLEVFAGRTLDVPTTFIAGKSDWGIYQRPGSFERMQSTACARFRGAHILDGAGHWVQQEQAEGVSELLIQLLTAR
ncbi:MAG: alpha/beta fold hydrolase [Acidobacteria bacterium]|nr:alpha/beta fold hydrolase [Acidobacteriota bacterium]